jgi:hypothetical protein
MFSIVPNEVRVCQNNACLPSEDRDHQWGMLTVPRPEGGIELTKEKTKKLLIQNNAAPLQLVEAGMEPDQGATFSSLGGCSIAPNEVRGCLFNKKNQ